MSVLENFKNIPRSPFHRATGPKCYFFFSNLQRSPWRKKKGACRPPQGRQGPVARWGGDRVLLSAGRHSLCHLSLKIQEKREGWGEEKRRNSAELRTPDLQVTSV